MRTPSCSCSTPRLLGGPSGADRLRQELRSRFEDFDSVAFLPPRHIAAKQRIPVRNALFWSYTAPLISKWIIRNRIEGRHAMRMAKLESLILVILLSSAVALTAKDATEYPLKVELLDNTW